MQRGQNNLISVNQRFVFMLAKNTAHYFWQSFLFIVQGVCTAVPKAEETSVPSIAALKSS